MSLDTNAKTALATAAPGAILYDTLELDHPSFNLAMVAGFEALTDGGKTYQPYAFNVTPPSIEEGANSELEAVISNVRRSIPTLIIGALESLSPIKIYHRVHIIGGGVDSIIQPELPMEIISATENEDAIVIRAAFVNILDAVFLTENYDVLRFPGLV